MLRKYIFNSFSLKIIAMVTMAIDHFGIIYSMFWLNGMSSPFYDACRALGRIAMPLYAFMIVEGVLHTSNYKKYALRLGIMAAIISTALAVTYFVPNLNMTFLASYGNIFLDLLLGSFMIYALNHKNKYFKLLAILPMAIGILSFIAKCVEYEGSCHTGCAYKLIVEWFPQYLRLQYDWLSLALMLGFYLAYKLAIVFYKVREESTGLKLDNMIGTNEHRIVVNLFGILFIIIFAFLYYSFKYTAPNIVWWNPNNQLFMMLTAVFLLLYNGNKGYSSKWFNHVFTYLYYPVHIVLIYGICYLLYLL